MKAGLMTTNELNQHVEAVIGLEEALDVAPAATARMIGPQRFVLIYQIVGVSAGMLVGALLSAWLPAAFAAFGSRVPVLLEPLMLVFGLLGWSLGLSRAQSLHRAKFVAGIRRRGMPAEVTMSFAIEDAGLRIATPRMTYCIAWDAVLELVETSRAWLIQADNLTFVLPRRAFSDKLQEKAFLARLLGRVRPEVKARSVEADRLASKA